MIEPEQHRQQDPKRQRQEDVADTDLPEPDEPTPFQRRLKRNPGWQILQMDTSHPSNMHEAREKHHRQWRPVILEEDSDLMIKEAAVPQLAADISNDKHQQRHHDGEVEWFLAAEELQNLDSFFEVDAGYIEAEDIAGKPGDISQPVT